MPDPTPDETDEGRLLSQLQRLLERAEADDSPAARLRASELRGLIADIVEAGTQSAGGPANFPRTSSARWAKLAERAEDLRMRVAQAADRQVDMRNVIRRAAEAGELIDRAAKILVRIAKTVEKTTAAHK